MKKKKKRFLNLKWRNISLGPDNLLSASILWVVIDKSPKKREIIAEKWCSI